MPALTHLVGATHSDQPRPNLTRSDYAGWPRPDRAQPETGPEHPEQPRTNLTKPDHAGWPRPDRAQPETGPEHPEQPRTNLTTPTTQDGLTPSFPPPFPRHSRPLFLVIPAPEREPTRRLSAARRTGMACGQALAGGRASRAANGRWVWAPDQVWGDGSWARAWEGARGRFPLGGGNDEEKGAGMTERTGGDDVEKGGDDVEKGGSDGGWQVGGGGGCGRRG